MKKYFKLSNLLRGIMPFQTAEMGERATNRRMKKNLSPKHLQLETLEERQLLAVTPTRMAWSEVEALYPEQMQKYTSFERGTENVNVYEVNSLADLRDALTQAGTTAEDDLILAGGNTFTFTSGTDTMVLNVDAASFGTISIIGTDSSNPLTIDAKKLGRLFTIAEGTSVNFGNVALENGFFTELIEGQVNKVKGGGILNEGRLTFVDVSMTGNAVSAASATGFSSYALGGAVYNSGTFTVVNSHFSSNTATGTDEQAYVQGGAIVNYGQLTVTGSDFTGNKAINSVNSNIRYGGAIANQSDGKLDGVADVKKSTFTKNEAYFGAGLYTSWTAAVDESTFDGNIGEGLHNNVGTLTVKNSFVKNNTGNGIGGQETDSGTLAVSNTEINNNTGNGIFNSGAGLVVKDSKIYNNSQSGIVNTGNDQTISNVEIYNNGSHGIWNSGSNVSVSNVADYNNVATGVYNTGTMTILKSQISGNQLSGIYSTGEITASRLSITGNKGYKYQIIENGRRCGGGIYNTGTFILSNSEVADNSIYVTNYDGYTIYSNFYVSCCGGGIYNEGNLTLANVDITKNSVIFPNLITDDEAQGGGLFNSGEVTLANVLISENSSVQKNSVEEGGGIYNSGTLALTNTEISKNYATLDGAGIFTTSAVTGRNVTVAGNSSLSTSGTGGISGSDITLTNSIVAYNFNGNGTISGNNNITENDTTVFVVRPTFETNGAISNGSDIDLHLKYSDDSIAIDAGDNTAVADDETDLDGNIRKWVGKTASTQAIVDIGAYEYGSEKPASNQLATPALTVKTTVGEDTAVLSWGEVLNAEEYQYQYKLAGEDWTSAKTGYTKDLTVTVSGLDMLTKYDFRLMAAGDGEVYEDSDWSETITRKIGAVAIDAPNLNVEVKRDANYAKLSWNAVENATAYEYQYKLNSSKTWSEAVKTTEFSAELTNCFTLMQRYDFRVRAIGDGQYNDDSDYSVVTKTVGAESIDAPILDVVINGTTATLNWTSVIDPNGTAAASYAYHYRIAGTSTWSEEITPETPTALTAAIEGLNADTNYEFQVRAYPQNTKAFAESDWSESVFRKTNLDPLTAPAVASNAGALGADLVWANNRQASGYEVQYMLGTGDDWSSAERILIPHSDEGGQVTVPLTELLPKTEYSYRVRAIGDEVLWRDSEWTAGTFTTTETLPAPENLTASEIRAASVTLEWDRSPSADHYTIRYRTASTTEGVVNPWNYVNEIYEESVKVGNLTADTAYEFQVQANGPQGTAVDSAWPEDTAVYKATTLKTLDASKVTMEAVSIASVDITWTKVNNAAGYVLYFDGEQYAEYGADVTGCTIGNLEFNSYHQVQIIALGAAGYDYSVSDVDSAKTWYYASTVVNTEEDEWNLSNDTYSLREAVYYAGTFQYTEKGYRVMNTTVTFDDSVHLSDDAQGNIVISVLHKELGEIVIDANLDKTSTAIVDYISILAGDLTLDVNGDGFVHSDDIELITRYLSGSRGDDLTAGLNPALWTCSAEEIAENIQVLANTKPFDINDNGEVDADDYELLIRYQAGMTGEELIEGFDTDDWNRTDPNELAAYMAEKANDLTFDFNGDGVFNKQDAELLSGYASGLRNEALLAPFTELQKRDWTRTTSDAVISYIESLSFAPLDINGDGKADAETDGLLLANFFTERSSESLIAGIDTESETWGRTIASGIQSYIGSLMKETVDVSGKAYSLLDLNADGKVDETDTVLLTRYVNGLTGSALVEGFTDKTGWVRNTAKKITDYIEAYLTKYDQIDFNADGSMDAVDAELFSRYVAGKREDNLVRGFNTPSSAAWNRTAEEMTDYMDQLRKNLVLDIDGDGLVNEKDQILLARYRAGLRGNALTADLNLTESTRKTGDEIAKQIETLILNKTFDINWDDSVDFADFKLIDRYFDGKTGNNLTAGLDANLWGRNTSGVTAEYIQTLRDAGILDVNDDGKTDVRIDMELLWRYLHFDGVSYDKLVEGFNTKTWNRKTGKAVYDYLKNSEGVLDVNGNGKFDLEDYTLINRFVQGDVSTDIIDGFNVATWSRKSGEELAAYIKTVLIDTKAIDVNADGIVDESDYTLLFRYGEGLRGNDLISGFDTRNWGNRKGSAIEEAILLLENSGQLDINGDGAVDAVDYQILNRYRAGKRGDDLISGYDTQGWGRKNGYMTVDAQNLLIYPYEDFEEGFADGQFVIDADENSRGFDILDGMQSVTMIGLGVINGKAAGTDAFGGGIYSGSDYFELVNGVVANNTALAESGTVTSSNALGGGIYGTGSVVVRKSNLENNTAQATNTRAGLSSYAAASGGAVYALGDASVISYCYVTGNTAAADSTNGYAVVKGGGLVLTGSVVNTLVNLNTARATSVKQETTSQAYAMAFGGGIAQLKTLTVTNSTIAKNTVWSTKSSDDNYYVFGGGICALVYIPQGTYTQPKARQYDITVNNSIVVLNFTSKLSDTEDDLCAYHSAKETVLGNTVNKVIAGSGNVSSYNSWKGSGQNLQIIDKDEMTDLFVDVYDPYWPIPNTDPSGEGVHEDYHLAEDSKASGLGIVDLAVDENGAALIFDLDFYGRYSLSGISAGVYEWNGSHPHGSLHVTTELDIVNAKDDVNSLREALEYARTLGGSQTITFDDTLYGKTITIDWDQWGNDGTFAVNMLGLSALTFDASSLSDPGKTLNITVDAGNKGRAFDITSEQLSVAFNGLNITNGKADNGAAIQSAAKSLAISNGELTNNTASQNGGAVAVTGGDLKINAVLFEGDSAMKNGGALYVADGNLTVEDSVFNSSNAEEGGAAAVVRGDADMDSVRFTGNTATANGGAVSVTDGDLLIQNSELTQNTAAAVGGAIALTGGELTVNYSYLQNNKAANGGAAAVTNNSAEKTEHYIINSLLAGNSADAGGGAVWVNGYAGLTVRNSTFADNGAAAGKVLALTGRDAADQASADLYNTIIVTCADDKDALLLSKTNAAVSGWNILSSIADSQWDGGADWYAYDKSAALFEEFSAGNYRLAENSQAIGLGNNDEAVDKDGNPLTYDLDGHGRIHGPFVDLGAYECYATAQSLIVTTALDVVDKYDNETSLREAVLYANELGGTQTISFLSTLDGAVFTLTDGELAITNTSLNLTIDAYNLSSDRYTALGDVQAEKMITVDADKKSRAFSIAAVESVELINMTIQNGLAEGEDEAGFGGGIYSQAAALTLTDSLLNSNKAVTGGAVYQTGELHFRNTSALMNTAAENGGAVYVDGDMTVTSGSEEDASALFSGNKAENGGAVYQESGMLQTGDADSAVNPVRFIGNTAAEEGGALYLSGSAELWFTEFQENTAASGGGITAAYASGSLDIYNALITDNVGGGIANSGTLTAVNTTIAYNSEYGAENGEDAVSWFKNSIVVMNGGSDIIGGEANGSYTLSAFEGWNESVQTYKYKTFIDLFADAENGDYRLSSLASQAIDTGNDDDVSWTSDLDGKDRIIRTVDLGAYEYQGTTPPPAGKRQIVYAVDGATTTTGIETWSDALEAEGKILSRSYQQEAEYYAVEGSDVAVSIYHDYFNDQEDDDALTTMSLRIHYNSSILDFDEMDYGWFTKADSKSVQSNTRVESFADTENFDNDKQTDRYILITWNNNSCLWSDGGTTEHEKAVFQALFTVKDTTYESTKVNFSVNDLTAGYGFTSNSALISLLPVNFDLDGDGTVNLSTDFNIAQKYFQAKEQGTSVTGLTRYLTSESTRSVSEIVKYLDAYSDAFDIDGDGIVTQDKDGVLLSRYLSGYRKEKLTAGLTLTGERTLPSEITAYIEKYLLSNEIAPAAEEGTHTITVSQDTAAVTGSTFDITLSHEYDGFSATQPGTTLSIRVHYNSSDLSFIGYNDAYLNNIIGPDGDVVVLRMADTEDWDNDETTDSYVQITWNNPDNLGFYYYGLQDLIDLTFKVENPASFPSWTDDLALTKINVTAADKTAGYGFASEGALISLYPNSFSDLDISTQTVPLAALDINGDGVVDISTDCNLLYFYVSGITIDQEMVDRLLGNKQVLSLRRSAEDINAYLDKYKPVFDIDGSGKLTMNDVNFVTRYLSQKRGDDLVDPLLGPSTKDKPYRDTAEKIAAYIKLLLPKTQQTEPVSVSSAAEAVSSQEVITQTADAETISADIPAAAISAPVITAAVPETVSVQAAVADLVSCYPIPAEQMTAKNAPVLTYTADEAAAVWAEEENGETFLWEDDIAEDVVNDETLLLFNPKETGFAAGDADEDEELDSILTIRF